MKILLVEDNLTTAQIVLHLLRKIVRGEVVEVYNGEEAVRRLREESFDLVIVDWVLPGLSGVEIVRWMRRQPGYAHTPVLMMTAKDRPEDLLEAVEAGANDYVLKPAELQVLFAKIRRLVHRPVPQPAS